MTRGRKKKLQQHVRTSIVARTIYRIICVTLVVVGVFGLYQALTIADNYVAYTKRTTTAKATIRGVRRTTDRYGNESCRVKYDFKLGDKEYSSKTGWRQGNRSRASTVKSVRSSKPPFATISSTRLTTPMVIIKKMRSGYSSSPLPQPSLVLYRWASASLGWSLSIGLSRLKRMLWRKTSEPRANRKRSQRGISP